MVTDGFGKLYQRGEIVKRQIIKSVLCGLLYTVLFQVALALRWATIEEHPAFIAAALAGITIALIIGQDNAKKTFLMTLLALICAFLSNLIAGRLGIANRIFLYFNPELERMAVNDKFTLGYVTLGFFAISLIFFLFALAMRFLLSNRAGDRANENNEN